MLLFRDWTSFPQLVQSAGIMLLFRDWTGLPQLVQSADCSPCNQE